MASISASDQGDGLAAAKGVLRAHLSLYARHSGMEETEAASRALKWIPPRDAIQSVLRSAGQNAVSLYGLVRPLTFQARSAILSGEIKVIHEPEIDFLLRLNSSREIIADQAKEAQEKGRLQSSIDFPLRDDYKAVSLAKTGALEYVSHDEVLAELAKAERESKNPVMVFNPLFIAGIVHDAVPSIRNYLTTAIAKGIPLIVVLSQSVFIRCPEALAALMSLCEEAAAEGVMINLHIRGSGNPSYLAIVFSNALEPDKVIKPSGLVQTVDVLHLGKQAALENLNAMEKTREYASLTATAKVCIRAWVFWDLPMEQEIAERRLTNEVVADALAGLSKPTSSAEKAATAEEAHDVSTAPMKEFPASVRKNRSTKEIVEGLLKGSQPISLVAEIGQEAYDRLFAELVEERNRNVEADLEGPRSFEKDAGNDDLQAIMAGFGFGPAIVSPAPEAALERLGEANPKKKHRQKEVRIRSPTPAREDDGEHEGELSDLEGASA